MTNMAGQLNFKFNSDLALVFVLGVATAFAFPPYGQLLISVLAFAAFIGLLFNNLSRGFVYGLLFGLGQFLVAFHWLMPSMTEYGQMSASAAYTVYFLVCLEVALYPAVSSYLASRLSTRLSLWSLLLLPSLWVLGEWLRSNMFPFAWDLIGYSFYPYPALLQVADIGSVYLLSFLYVFFAVGLALLVVSLKRRSVFFPVAWSLPLVFAVVWLYGDFRLESIAEEIRQSEKLNVAVVQGNINQADKWQPSKRQEGLEIYRSLSLAVREPVDLIVWPESSLSLYHWDQQELMSKLQEIVTEKHADLLLGIDTATGAGANKKYFNSMLLLSAEQGIVGQYNKFQRVPFGEYMPMHEYLPRAIGDFKLSAGYFNVEAGEGVSVMPWQNLTLAPLICYESIFPRYARAQSKMGADVYINVSNDAWFAEAGKSQHLQMTRLRAIENRRPVIRVANTGITAIYDALGNQLAVAGSNQREAVVVSVPLSSSYALNTDYGQYFIVLCLLLVLAAGVQKKQAVRR